MNQRSHLGVPLLSAAMCLVAVAPLATEAGKYFGPVAVVAAHDGKTLYVANADARQVAVVDAAGRNVTRSIDLPGQPTGLVLSPDGKTLYVTCAAPNSTVAAIDVATGKLTATMPAGHTAVGPAISPDGKTLYVCNRFDNDVSVIDLATKRQTARVPVGREPLAAAISPDGTSLMVINHLPLDRADAYDVATAVTVIDTRTNGATTIRLPNGSTAMRGICLSPDGRYAYATHILARYQMPTTQLERGWMNTNALSIIDVAGKKLINTVLLDDVDLGAANPWGVATTADGKTICVTHAGTHEISLIDAEALMKKLLALPAADDASAKAPTETQAAYTASTAADVPNDLAMLVGLRRRIRLQGGGPWGRLAEDGAKVNGPRGLAVVGSTAYVTAYFTDNLAVVDLEPRPGKVVSTVALGPPPQPDVVRRGEMLFHDAHLCFQHWQSCTSCHPDARVDGLNWDLLNDGLGNPKNTRSMLLAHATPPAMASGVRPTGEEAVRAGLTHIQFAVRPEQEAAAIDAYLKALPPVASPYLVDGKLSPAAQRGRTLFFDEAIGCAKCHPEPLFTDKRLHDVGSRGRYDRRDTFDTPTLVECWRTAPYMHDGQYTTMKELLTTGQHGRKGGDLDQLSPPQLDDLVEFVLSLLRGCPGVDAGAKRPN